MSRYPVAIVMKDLKSERIFENLRDTMERVRSARADAQLMWSRAHEALEDAAKVRERIQAQVAEIDDGVFRRRYRQGLLNKILVAAVADTHADMATSSYTTRAPATGR